MTDDAKVLAHRMYEAFNTRDVAAAKTIFSADFVSHPLGTVGIESVMKAWAGMHATFPGLRILVEDMLSDGDGVAVRTTLHGTPADKPPAMMEFFRVRDGRIAELWGLSTLSRP
ncbi:ester cyclase [Streptosporangium sandarakinum]|uniref:ester cyclase n=1 Tax=Streptosporangium sandarakinum TaxID=1260955 RepID=UPI0037159401